MFTGIIEDLGTVIKIDKKNITINTLLDDIKIGDSVSINGSCLTAIKIEKLTKNEFQITFDVSEETLKRTNLGKLKVGDRVNLERAMKADGRFGGHFVNGHVEATGKILSIKRLANSEVWEFSNPEDLSVYIVEKGSIAIDGISLTIAEKSPTSFKVSLIPHTLKNTTLGIKKAGEAINLETDILSKYVLQRSESRGITKEKLKKAGYL
ncbi:MAG: riboflavin synthase subunit alpha [Elusimicrobia bacterium RIFOXYD2_FULL_34_15]|nr:MAG: riboflavin synthase subunit alpha [Elusimicrobia bacterium RIFOXYD2_FULL_34_15]